MSMRYSDEESIGDLVDRLEAREVVTLYDQDIARLIAHIREGERLMLREEIDVLLYGKLREALVRIAGLQADKPSCYGKIKSGSSEWDGMTAGHYECAEEARAALAGTGDA